MICVPCNIQFRNEKIKVCPYCDKQLTEKGRPEVKHPMEFPDENDRGQKGEIRRPVSAMPKAMNVLKPSVPGEYHERPSNRKLRLRKMNRFGKRPATTK